MRLLERSFICYTNGKLVFLTYFFETREKYWRKEGNAVKQEEKKPTPWEVVDPKPPVIRSGRMEDRRSE